MKLQTSKHPQRRSVGIAIAAALLVASAAHAATDPAKLKLSGFIDAAEGQQLLAGDYAAVIDRLAPHAGEFREDEVAASTNLCVAYVAMGKLDNALEACDEAIQMARLEEAGLTRQEQRTHTDVLAVAYANRAVLTKLAGE